jgi:hypothetical protein
MEALFSRGGMPIHHRINGFNYVFTRNDDGDFVCPVLSGEHRQMMVKGGNFRVYEPKVKAPAHADVPLITTRPVEASEEVAFAPEPEVRPRRGGRRKKADAA